MPRPAGSKNKSTLEFVARYETKARQLRRANKAAGLLDAPCDPFDVLWAIALSGTEESQHRVQASRALLVHRFPVIKSIEVNGAGEPALDVVSAGQLVLAWDADAAA